MVNRQNRILEHLFKDAAQVCMMCVSKNAYVILFAVCFDVVQGKCQTAEEILLEEDVSVPNALER